MVSIGESQEVIGGFAGLTGGLEDRTIVGAQYLKPRTEIVGMANRRDNAQGSAEESRSQFGGKFLAGIGAIAETPTKSPRQPRGVAGPVGVMPISA